jgi:hypothetical protein
MTKPTIHSNGTSAQSLALQYSEARVAVETALEAMQNAAPNGRDYYVQGAEALDAAIDEHRVRCATLRVLVRDLETLEAHCAEFIR